MKNQKIKKIKSSLLKNISLKFYIFKVNSVVCLEIKLIIIDSSLTQIIKLKLVDNFF